MVIAREQERVLKTRLVDFGLVVDVAEVAPCQAARERRHGGLRPAVTLAQRPMAPPADHARAASCMYVQVQQEECMRASEMRRINQGINGVVACI